MDLGVPAVAKRVADDTTRRQELSYRRDGLLQRSTWNAGSAEEKVTTHDHSPGGLLEGVTDWRERTSSFDYAPAGNLTETSLGDAASQWGGDPETELRYQSESTDAVTGNPTLHTEASRTARSAMDDPRVRR
ncbi:MAG: hypothetical protein ACRDK3_11020 [Actinomycetota bacterium]